MSARAYDRYSGTLMMECKRMGDVACENLVASNGQSGAPAPSAARDLRSTDETRASYVGGLLASRAVGPLDADEYIKGLLARP